MRFAAKIWVVLVAAALVHGAAWAASFTAQLDRESMALGEQATLSLKFDDIQPQDAPAIPEVAGLEFQYVGPSSNFSFINGRTTSSVTYTYIVTAEREGAYTIPAMQVQLGGQRLISKALKLAVAKVNAPAAADVASGREPAFLKLVVPKTQVYVGEPMVAELDLYLRDDVEGLNNFQLNSSPTDGFNAGKTTEQQGMRRRAQLGNRVYTVIPLSLPLTALRPGSLTLGPFAAGVVVTVPSQNQGGDPFFNRFFHQGQQKQVALSTEALAVKSLALPTEKQPANFNGAVGDFTLTASAGPTAVTVGDPITVRVQIAGRGVLDSLSLPVQDAWHEFKTYPPTTKVEATDQFGFQGTKTFEQIISPQNADVHEVPALAFSYFNPDDGAYHTLTQPAVALTVRTAAANAVPALASAKNAAPEGGAPQDILPLKVKLGRVARGGEPWVAQRGFLAAQSVPVLAFVGALLWRRRTDSLANNPRRRRQRAVAQLIGAGLVELKGHAAANRPDEFFAKLIHLLQEQLGERLDCPALAITENVIEEHAVLRAAPAAVREALREQFQLCNQARYAPVRGTAELNSVAAQFEKLVGELQELKA